MKVLDSGIDTVNVAVEGLMLSECIREAVKLDKSRDTDVGCELVIKASRELNGGDSLISSAVSVQIIKDIIDGGVGRMIRSDYAWDLEEKYYDKENVMRMFLLVLAEGRGWNKLGIEMLETVKFNHEGIVRKSMKVSNGAGVRTVFYDATDKRGSGVRLEDRRNYRDDLVIDKSDVDVCVNWHIEKLEEDFKRITKKNFEAVENKFGELLCVYYRKNKNKFESFNGFMDHLGAWGLIISRGMIKKLYLEAGLSEGCFRNWLCLYKKKRGFVVVSWKEIAATKKVLLGLLIRDKNEMLNNCKTK